jgi:hypothetical protein|tara:strand:+ start:128 stop:331 length:204 start_codon:yes stop_codon:yes gene_type:complete
MVPEHIDDSLRKRAKDIIKEAQDNTTSCKRGLDEFAEYSGYFNSESMLYNIFRNIAEQVLYDRKLNG